MKKYLSLALAVLLLLSLTACGGSGDKESATLQVGFAREDITPLSPVWIAGGGDASRISENVLDYLYVTCVAVTDKAGNTQLFITQDLINSTVSMSEPARQAISEKTGVPVDNIIIGATHTHSAPGYYSPSRQGIPEYVNLYDSAIVRVCERAMADRAPATMSTGSVDAEGYVFVRRYYLDDGSVQGATGNKSASTTITDHLYDANDTMQMVRFIRADKKDVLMTNIGVHATFNGSTHLRNISADFPAGLRSYVEGRETDLLVAYFISAAGDQVADSDLPEKAHNLDYIAYGEKLGEFICNALPSLQPVNDGVLKISNETLTAKTNLADPSRQAEAAALWARMNNGGEGFAVCEAAAKAAGFAGIYECMAITDRSKQKETRTCAVYTVTLGEMSFVAMPYEMTGASSADLVSRSPYGENTFIITCANGSNGYIPHEFLFDAGTYESYNSYYEKSTAEALVDLALKQLTAHKG